MVNTQKKSQVEALLTLIKSNPSFVLVKVDKTTHQNLENLRKELRKVDSSIKVIKNTLFEKAINRVAVTDPLFKDLKKKFLPLKETSAIICFKKNWDSGLKSFFEFSQKEKSLTFKFSLLDKIVYDNNETEKIAKLPGKDQLVAQLIGSLKAPMSNFIYALKYNTNKFVYILQSKSKQS